MAFNLPWPSPTVAPDVPYHMKQLADAVDELLDVPAPGAIYHPSGGNTFNSSAWAPIPNLTGGVTLAFTHKTLVQVIFQGYMGNAASEQSARVGVRAAGALNEDRTSLRETAILRPGNRVHTTLTHYYAAPVGTTTWTPIGIVTTGTDAVVDYARFEVLPLRVMA